MKRWNKKRWLIISVLVLLTCAIPVPVQAKEQQTIEKGIYADGIELSGMSTTQAQAAIESYVEEIARKQIVLVSVRGVETPVTASELGLTWTNPELVQEAVSLGKEGTMIARYKARKDLQKNKKVFPIELAIDRSAVGMILESRCAEADVPAKDASLRRENGEFVIEKGQTGMKLDVAASTDAVCSFLEKSWDHQDTSIDLIVIKDAPRANAESLAMVKDVLGTFTTSYSSSNSNRSGNIATGCKHVDGITLFPGDTFSMADAVTPFSEANGYYMAGSYLNGKVVDSLGGGICQVSTTLYNAVLRAELQVDERSNHSMIVSYVDPSADAAIAVDSGKDFKFTNNTDYPIYIEGIAADKKITFTIYGVETRDPNRKVTYESVVLEKNVPETEVIYTDAAAPVGSVITQSAHIGYKAQLWKVVTVDGVETERVQVNSSTYKSSPRQATVGTATNDPNIYNLLMAAIATNDINHVKQVAAGLKAASENPPQPVVPVDPQAVIPQPEVPLP